MNSVKIFCFKLVDLSFSHTPSTKVGDFHICLPVIEDVQVSVAGDCRGRINSGSDATLSVSTEAFHYRMVNLNINPQQKRRKRMPNQSENFDFKPYKTFPSNWLRRVRLMDKKKKKKS